MPYGKFTCRNCGHRVSRNALARASHQRNCTTFQISSAQGVVIFRGTWSLVKEMATKRYGRYGHDWNLLVGEPK